MEKKTDYLKEDRIKSLKDDSICLNQARLEALNQSVHALERVIILQKISNNLSAPNGGNIHVAKKDILDAIVNLAIASSDGSHSRTKSILSEYGLEDMV